jgi:hypothetical protein
MTPREVLAEALDAPVRNFSSRDLVLHGRPNWPAAIFFATIAILHTCIALNAFPTSPWEGLISAFLAVCFMLVADLCLLSRNQITIRPIEREIHLHGGFGKFSFERDLPFSSVRAVRVTLWESRRRQRSRVEILCDGEEISCPPTTIPREQALFLALVMNVRLIRITQDRPSRH